MDPQQQGKEDNDKLFMQLDAYSWDTDAEFQGGLQAILGNVSSLSQIQALTLRARCFYFSRKNNNIPIDFEAYKSHYLATHELDPSSSSQTPIPETQASQASASSSPTSNPQPSTDTNPQYPQTFAHLVSLIQRGAPIPGIKEILPTVLADQATAPKASRRRKPWETGAAETDEEGAALVGTSEKQEGTFGDHRDEVIVQEFPKA